MAMGDGLLEIIKEARQIAADDQARPLLDCPICGNTLTIGTREKMCDVGHFRTEVGATVGSY